MNAMAAMSVITNQKLRRALVAAFGTALAFTWFAVNGLPGAERARSANAASAERAAPGEHRSGRATRTALFPCGDLSCDAQTTYCETINTDVPALPSNYACRPLPANCAPREDGRPRDCGCFPPRTRGDYCSAPVKNGAQVFYRTTVGGH